MELFNKLIHSVQKKYPEYSCSVGKLCHFQCLKKLTKKRKIICNVFLISFTTAHGFSVFRGLEWSFK